MTAISSVMNGVVVLGAGGEVVLLNPVAEQLLGLSALMALGERIDDVAGDGELLAALRGERGRAASGRSVSRVVEVHHDGRDLLYIRLTLDPLRDHDGVAAGQVCVLEDVTADHKSDQLKNQYLSIVAHELRTPLTGIKTYSTMMAKGMVGELDARQQEVIGSIREQSLRLEHQIDKLVNLGLLESTDYVKDLEVFELPELLEAVCAPFQQAARDRDIALAIAVDDDVRPRVQGDREDLKRALQALVENAVKFTPEGGRVTVGVTTGDGRARIHVRDTGIGIDPRYHRRIFEKFFQVEDPLTRYHGGAGLGLFVAAGIVEAHETRIDVRSELGKGAEFAFVLPIHEGGQELPEGGTASPAAAVEAQES